MKDLCDEFCQRYGVQLLDEIVAAATDGVHYPHIWVEKVEKHNSLNYTYTGRAIIAYATWVTFVIENGDSNGTWMSDYDERTMARVFDMMLAPASTPVEQLSIDLNHYLSLTLRDKGDLRGVFRQTEKAFGAKLLHSREEMKAFEDFAAARRLICAINTSSTIAKKVSEEDLTTARIAYLQAADKWFQALRRKLPPRRAKDELRLKASAFFLLLGEHFFGEGRCNAAALAKRAGRLWAEKQYVLVSDTIPSKNDFQTHRIPARDLARLYQVPLALCHIWRHDEAESVKARLRKQWENLIWLYPDYSGTYEIEPTQPG
ncbi:hypothetical protein CcrC1_gp359 [Caulobacter phage C1]|nr:hypothetical protein CcrC1_gp359 [Caulobacter phage C1]UTU08588.1 hypothetical protein CcrC2_gp360 [Caulobacter phage C2]UTU09104.1 hypothetical protein CcrJ4_gp355 [Caulobacter phage J4]UTU09662.1 hypothetical protein CcrBL47_gp377 [Caulobacter phage BL47]UTU10221.1 hypothetical protein CcrRB23_gp359 [Caulobacter phage RB23]WGN97255.1 hypothetical protein [Bertelyvirus sp.]